MPEILLAFAFLILLSMVGGMFRIVRGPTRADRMLAALLLGTNSVAILLLLAAALERPAYVDVALVFAGLAVIVSVAFVRLAWRPSKSTTEQNAHARNS